MQIDHRGKVDPAILPPHLGEVSRPDVVPVRRYRRMEQVGIGHGNPAFSSPYASPSAVGTDVEAAHDPLGTFAVTPESGGDPAGTVRGVLTEDGLDRYLKRPVPRLFFRHVVERGAGDPKRACQCGFTYRTSSSLQVFFWAWESRTVSSPTSSNSSRFCFWMRENSEKDGAP